MSTRKYLSKQRQMFGYQAEDRLSKGHICFLIDEVVDDLELGPSARGVSVFGAPCYDPCMMVKVLFYGYARGIRSSRKLAAECRENIGFIRLSQGQQPDFRTIALFRKENGPLLERAFSSLVRRLMDAGVVGVSHIIIDGTKVHANASNSRIIQEKFFDEVKDAIEEWMSSSSELDAAEDLREKLSSVGVKTSSLGVEGLQHLVDRCGKAVKDGENDKAKKVSTTDPDSRFMRDGVGGRINLGYNVQTAVDAETGIPVGCDVTQDANDSWSLGRMIEVVERCCRETVQAVDADSDFFRSDSVQSLESLGKDICALDNLAITRMRRGELEALVYDEKFVYDADRDVFVCPEGNEHVFRRLNNEGDGTFRRAYVSERRCDGCVHRESCFGASKLKRHVIRKHEDYPWLWKHRKRFLEPSFQARLKSRKLIEKVFGHWKHNLGFRKLLLRGLSGAKVETFLVSTASVLRRLCNILKRSGRSWASLARTPGLAG
ncbi:IS1182 family transposase [bacterium]|nr:IS1182 family transposase [bacterium]